MPSPEQASFFILKNDKQDSVVGISHNNPSVPRQSYWLELLQKQINNDGKRQLILLIAYTDKTGETKTFEDLRGLIQNLSEEECDHFLFGIIEQIYQAKQVLLIETNEEKYIPINENRP